MNLVDGLIAEKIWGTKLKANQLVFKGTYDASSNTPPTPLSVGEYYIISNGGTFDGNVYSANDWTWWNGTVWGRTPQLTTGVSMVNGKTLNVILDTDDILEGVNKYVTAAQLNKINNLPNNTALELSTKFDTASQTSDAITQGTTKLFLTVAERNKLSNVPADTNTLLDSKFETLTDTMDDIQDGVTYVKTENNFTDAFMTKLSNLQDNFKGSHTDPAALRAAYPTASASNYAIVQSTATIWIWSIITDDWVDTEQGSTGDMLQSVYDPSGVAANVYDMDNMVDGIAKVGMTVAERSKLSGLDTGNKLTVTALEKSAIATIGDKVTEQGARNAVGGMLADTNTIDFTYIAGTPTMYANVKTQNTTTANLSADASGLKVDVVPDSVRQLLAISKNGSTIGTRKEINLIEGTNVGLSFVDDPANGRVNVTVNSTAVAGSVQVSKEGTPIVTSVTDIDFFGDVTVSDEGSNKAKITITAGSSTDELFKISAADTTAGYFESKILGATNKLTLTKNNTGANETITLGIGTDIFDKSSNTIDDITDGSTYVKYSAVEKAKLAGITNPMLFKGGIALNSDFPLVADVQNGWVYRITADVIDDDPTKTNTGQIFEEEEEIVWNGTNWTSLGVAALKEFKDSEFRIYETSDPTKIAAFNASNITTGTSREYYLPNKSGTVALTSDINQLTTVAFNTGTTAIDSFDHTIYKGAKLVYSLFSDSKFRTGEVLIVTDGTEAKFVDVTVDIGTAIEVDFETTIVGNNVIISAVSLSDNWTIKYNKIVL